MIRCYVNKNQLKQHDNKYHNYYIEEDGRMIIHSESLEDTKWISLGEYEIVNKISKCYLREVEIEDCSPSSTITWYCLKGKSYDK